MKRNFWVLSTLMMMVAIFCTACSDDDGAELTELEDVTIQTDVDSDDGGSSGSGAVVPVTVKGLAADGESRLVFAIEADDDDPIEKFVVTSDVDWGVVEADATVRTIAGKDLYICTLTSEDDLPAALTNASVAVINYTIEATFATGVVQSATKRVEVVRPMVIFAHGLASGPDTFDPMLGYIRPMGLFVDAALYALDYSATSIDSYQTNNRVVPEAIDATRAAMLSAGYVAKKATLIGHSMGGILTRIYLQEGVLADDGVTQEEPYRDDILKVITIDTPHSGSQLADFALELGGEDGLSIFSSMGAIVDLAVNSTATSDLNNAAKLSAANALKIPTHIIAAHMGTLSDVVDLVKSEQYLYAVLSFLLDAVESKLLYGDDTSDIVVPTLSQLGGVVNTLTKKYVTTYENQWHCSVHTTSQAASDVVALLDTAGSDNKTFTTGFEPTELTYEANGLLQSGSPKVYLEPVTILPAAADVKSEIEFGIKDGKIVSVKYNNISMGDAASATETIYLARMSDDTPAGLPHIQYMKM